MSIANEIKRISQSKDSLKSSLESRGASVSENATIDIYPEILESCPHSVRGFFTPEEDTPTFSITGLKFTPHSLVLDSLELHSNVVQNAILMLMIVRDNAGAVIYYKENDSIRYIRTIVPTSSTVAWGENGVSFALPESLGQTLKAGYTYEYIISGGFEG